MTRWTICILCLVLINWSITGSNSCREDFLLANTYANATRYGEAETKFQQSFRCYYDLDSLNQALLSLSYIIDCQEKQFHYNAMSASLKDFREILFNKRSELKEEDFYNRFMSLVLLEGILMSRIGNLDSAINIYANASEFILQKLRRDPNSNDSVRFSKCLFFQASAQYEAGDFKRAVENFQNAFLMATPPMQKEGNHGFFIRYHIYLANAYAKLRQYDHALDQFEAARQLLSTLESRHLEWQFFVYSNLFSYYQAQDQNEQAASALTSIESLELTPFYRAKYLVQRGEFYQKYGDHLNAVATLQAAGQQIEQIQGKASLELAGCRLYLARSQFALGQIAAAKSTLDKALRALTIEIKGGKNESDLLLANNITLEILLEQAEIALHVHTTAGKANELIIANRTAQDAMNLLEKLRAQITLTEERERFVTNSRQAYELAIHTAYLLFQQSGNPVFLDTIYQNIERSKALNLREAISQHAMKRIVKLPDSLLIAEQILRSEVEEREKEMRGKQAELASTDPILQRLSLELSNARDRLSQHLEKYNEVYPEFSALEQKVIIPLLDEVRKALSQDEVVMEYFEGTKALYCLRISSEEVRIYQDSLTYPLRDWTVDFVSSIRNFPKEFSSLDLENYAASAYALYKALIPGDLKGKSLIIVPDGNIHRVIFECLLTEYPDDVMDIGSYRYLIDSFDFQYVYSMAMLHHGEPGRNSNYAANILAIAPDFKGLSEEYPELLLSGNVPEARKAVGYFRGKVLTDHAASRSNFLQQLQIKSRPFTIAHLATHGWASTETGKDSYILFKSIDLTDSAKLFAYDLYGLDLPTKMVYLSSCETGYGELQSSEGLVSLARGFFFAGVPSIITSLWPVSDREGSRLTDAFYSQLADGNSLRKGLGEAKRSFIRERQVENPVFSHPVYWSGYILLGENTTFYGSGNIWQVVLPIGCFILLTLLFLHFGRKKLFTGKRGASL